MSRVRYFMSELRLSAASASSVLMCPRRRFGSGEHIHDKSFKRMRALVASARPRVINAKERYQLGPHLISMQKWPSSCELSGIWPTRLVLLFSSTDVRRNSALHSVGSLLELSRAVVRRRQFQGISPTSYASARIDGIRPRPH